MRELQGTLSQEIQELSQDALIELFEVDLSNVGGEKIRFVNGTKDGKVVRFKDNEYFPIDFETSGWEVTTSGTLPRPTLKFANIKGFLSSLIEEYDDLLGCKITRIKTYKKYLDELTYVSLGKQILDTGPLNSGWYSLGEYTFDDSGQLNFEILEGIGSVIESIKLRNIETNESFEYRVENNVNHLRGKWSEFIVDSSWDDGFTWDDNDEWLERNKIAFFSDQVGASGIISFVKSGTYEIYYKTPLNVIPDVNALISLEIFNAVKNLNGSSHFPEDIYIIEQKTAQNRMYLEFELSSLLDYEGEYAPRRRIIRDYCSHTYRTYDMEDKVFIYDGVTCPWSVENTPDAYYDEQNLPIDIDKPWLDQCNFRLSGCTARFKNQSKPFYG